MSSRGKWVEEGQVRGRFSDVLGREVLFDVEVLVEASCDFDIHLGVEVESLEVHFEDVYLLAFL